MTQAGFTIAGSAHPICPVMLGDARLASLMADDMLKLGETAVKTFTHLCVLILLNHTSCTLGMRSKS